MIAIGPALLLLLQTAPGGTGRVSAGLTPSRMVTTSDPLTVVVAIANHTADPIVVEYVRGTLPEPLQLGVRDSVIAGRAGITIGPGTTMSTSISWPATKFHYVPVTTLGYRCGIHEVLIEIGYRPIDADSTAVVRTLATTTVEPRAGLIAIIVGGVAGVLLVSVLGALHGHARRPTDAPAPPAERRSVRNTLLTIAYGALSTTAAIYLLQATTVPGFPVSIELCDALGGLILGMFFKPVGSFIHTKVSATEADVS